ncbi:MAG: hypothetical protein AAFO86_00820 [Pseudomonadota bacterium]
MSYADTLAQALKISPRFPVQARSGLPFLRTWSARAGLLFDTTPLHKAMAPRVSRPTIAKLVQPSANTVQSTQAQAIVNFFAARLSDPTITAPHSIAHFSVIIPDLNNAVVAAARTNPDIMNEITQSTGLGYAVIAGLARLEAGPACVVEHFLAGSAALLNRQLMSQSARGTDPWLEATGRKQAYEWILEKQARSGSYFQL